MEYVTKNALFKVRRERKSNAEKNKQKRAGFQSHCTTSPHQPVYQIIPACKVVEKSVTKNLILQSMEGKKIGKIQGKISRRRLVLNPTIQQVIINLHTKYDLLACIVVEKSLTKNFILQSVEGKKIGQIQGIISRRRLVLNPMIQQVIINLYIKYEHSS